MRWMFAIFISLMVTATFVPCLSVRAQPSLVPHEDPAAAQSTLDSYSFLTQYAQIFALMSAQEFTNASRLSEELTHITVPEDLGYLIDRYNNLTQQLISVLSDLQSTLDSASRLLDQYRLDEVRGALDYAGVLVAQAQILLSDLQDATLTLSQRFGVFAAPAESKVRQAYDQLQSMLQELNNLINRYHSLLQEANRRSEEIKSENLVPTMLSLTLNTTRCFVGGYVSTSGVLSSYGQVLQNRAVELLLDGSQVAIVNTGLDGSYHAVIRIPYNYVDSISVSALYTPLGGDRGVYLASLGPTIKVEVLFYRIMLDISVPGVACPGLSLTIKGNATSQDGMPLDGRQVKALLDGSVIAQAKTDLTGVFAATPTIDSHAELGNHSLAVTVEPEGLYAGATVQKTLTIQKRESIVQVNAPSFILLPSQLQIRGTVNSASGFLRGANVLVDFANKSATVETLSDGSFSLTLDIPLNTAFAGYQDLRVTAQPSEPWQATAETKISVFVLNSASIAIALASSLSIFAVMYTRFTKTRNKKEKIVEVSTVSVVQEDVKASVSFQSSPEIKSEGIKGKVLKMYVQTLKAVQLATGDSLMPYMTLREYARATGSKIGGAADPFSELTTLAERSLYSSHEPKEEDMGKAESLASIIRRILSGGIA